MSIWPSVRNHGSDFACRHHTDKSFSIFWTISYEMWISFAVRSVAHTIWCHYCAHLLVIRAIFKSGVPVRASSPHTPRGLHDFPSLQKNLTFANHSNWDSVTSTGNTLLHGWQQHTNVSQPVPNCSTDSAVYPANSTPITLSQSAVISMQLNAGNFLILPCMFLTTAIVKQTVQI